MSAHFRHQPFDLAINPKGPGAIPMAMESATPVKAPYQCYYMLLNDNGVAFNGLLFKVAQGDDIFAVRDGHVTYADVTGPPEKSLICRINFYGSTVTCLYEGISPTASVGSDVKAGEKIGVVDGDLHVHAYWGEPDPDPVKVKGFAHGSEFAVYPVDILWSRNPSHWRRR